MAFGLRFDHIIIDNDYSMNPSLKGFMGMIRKLVVVLLARLS